MSVEAPLGATPQGGAFELTSSATAVELTSSATAVERAHALRRGRARTWREHAAMAAVVGVPLLGLLVCIAGTHTNALVPQSIRPVSATSMAGPLSFLGFNLGVPEVVAAIVLMFAGYLFAVNHVELVSTRTVIMGSGRAQRDRAARSPVVLDRRVQLPGCTGACSRSTTRTPTSHGAT